MEEFSFDNIVLTDTQRALLNDLTNGEVIACQDEKQYKDLIILQSLGFAGDCSGVSEKYHRFTIGERGILYIEFCKYKDRQLLKIDRRENINTAIAVSAFIVSVIALIIAS